MWGAAAVRRRRDLRAKREERRKEERGDWRWGGGCSDELILDLIPSHRCVGALCRRCKLIRFPLDLQLFTPPTPLNGLHLYPCLELRRHRGVSGSLAHITRRL